MDNRSIFSKTGKGSLEIAKKTLKLSSEERQTLILVDGKSNYADLQEKLSKIQPVKLRAVFERLIELGLIREFVGKSNAPEVAPATPEASGAAPRTGQPAIELIDGGEELDFTALVPAASASNNLAALRQAATAADEPADDPSGAALRDALAQSFAVEAAGTPSPEEAAHASREEAMRKVQAHKAAQAEAARVAAAKAEAARVAAAEAEAARARAAEEQARVAAEKAAEQAAKQAAEQAKEQARAAAEQAAEQARIKAETDRLAAEQRAREDKERQEREEVARLAAEEARRKAETDARIKAEAERLVREQRAIQEKERQEREAVARAAAEEEARVKAEAERVAREQREREEAVRRAAEEEARRKAEEEARLKAETERLAREQREREEAERRATEEEAKRKAEEEAERRAAEEEARRKAEEEARIKTEEEARIKAEAERLAREQLEREEAARRAAKEEAKHKAEEQARIKAEAERMAREQLEREAKEQREREQAAQRAAEEEARQKAAAARRAAEEEVRIKAEAERLAREQMEREDQERREREEAPKRAAEEAARRAAEEAARKTAEAARLKAEEDARLKAEADAEAQKNAEAERQAQQARERTEKERAEREAAEKQAAAAAAAATAAAAASAAALLSQQAAATPAAAPATDGSELDFAPGSDEQRRKDEVAKLLAGASRHDGATPLTGGGPDSFADTGQGIDPFADDGTKSNKEQELASRREIEQEARERADARAEPVAAYAPEPEAAPVHEKAPANERRSGGGLPLGKIFGAVAALVLVGAIGYVFMMPVDKPGIERALSERLGEPVTVDAAKVSPFSAALTLTGVNIGPLKLASVAASTDFSALFSSQKIWKSVEIKGLLIDAAAARSLVALGAREVPITAAGKVQIQRLRITDLEISGLPVATPKFNADILFTSSGTLKHITLTTADEKARAILQPEEKGWLVDVESKGVTWPAGPKIAWESVRAKGIGSANGIKFEDYAITHFGGVSRGSGELSWNNGWKFNGNLDAGAIESEAIAQAFYDATPVSGTIEGKLSVALSGASLPRMFETPQIDGALSVSKAILKTVDLARTAQTGATAQGSTRFTDFSTTLAVAGGRVQLKDIKGVSGLLTVSGNAQLDAAKNVSGGLLVELGVGGSRARANVKLSGTMAEPKLAK